jgi:transmembrane sensor
MSAKKLIAFPNRTRIREEAATWATRIDRGLSDAEREELKAWLGSPAHRQAFLEFAALWDQMRELSELAELFPLEERRVQTAASRPRSRWIPAAVAAGVALFAAVIAWYSRAPMQQPVASMKPDPAAIFETALGERTVRTLEDGSIVTLNTNSALEVRLTESSRELHLRRGEAYFAVAHDPARPFNVRAGDRMVQAVGTAFNVRLRERDHVEVTVTEGKVRVRSADSMRMPLESVDAPSLSANEAILVANESLLARAGASSTSKVQADEVDARLAWQRGMLVFRGDPLESVLTEVARYAPVTFVIDDATLRDIRVGGYFRAGDIEGLLFALEQNFRIEAKRTGENQIVLSRPENAG